MRRFWIGLALGVAAVWLLIRWRHHLASLLGWETVELGASERIPLPETPVSYPADVPSLDDSAASPANATSELLAQVRELIAREPSLQVYCPRCRTRQPVTDPQPVLTSKGRPAVRGTCAVCGSRVFQFVRVSRR